MRSIWLVSLAFAAAATLRGDGGTLVLRKQAGPLTISVFASPEPLRVGPVDLSVMVQRVDDKSEVLNGDVKMHLTRSSPDGISELFAPATHSNATNKLLYASRISLPAAGIWKLAVMVNSKSGNAEVAGEITVRPPQAPILAYWPYFAVVPLIVALFVINQWLKSKRISHPRARA